MLRIAICCGGGFSSSALANKLETDIKRLGKKDEIFFEFIPFIHLKERQDEVDIAMLCPHLLISAKQHKDEFHIPLYIIPPRLYGLMPVQDFVEDAEDIIALWNDHPQNIMTFADEEEPLRIRRMVSHRRFVENITN